MTYSHRRVEVHEAGDCDAATCPLCEWETELENAGADTTQGDS